MIGAFRVLLSMEVPAGSAAEFEDVWSAIAAEVSAHPANLAQALMRGSEPDERYHILTDWTDENSFRTFERSEAHVAYRKRLAPYRGAVTMSTMHIVRDVPGPVLERSS
ncbi:MAG TPA: antibiotic biosynthesis monooxygenase family protein [Rugosimonospora sp.]|nr:antibiotic biosynthesis monooxygenase family protein [Rugosimonospora sp.]